MVGRNPELMRSSGVNDERIIGFRPFALLRVTG